MYSHGDKWNIESINFLKENYFKFGIDYCSKNLNRTKDSIKIKTRQIGLRINFLWTKNEEQFLIDNYQKMGIKYCQQFLNRKKDAIFDKVAKLGLSVSDKHEWKDWEIEWLKINYPIYGHKYCVNNLRLSKFQIRSKAKELNLQKILLGLTIKHKIIKIARVKLCVLVKGKKCKKDKLFNLISCTPQFLRQYLESLFLPNMNWDNYGKNGWTIDHIKPCDSFDVSKIEELYKCFHYSNLRPLWNTTKIAIQNGDYKNIGNCNKGKSIIY